MTATFRRLDVRVADGARRPCLRRRLLCGLKVLQHELVQHWLLSRVEQAQEQKQRLKAQLHRKRGTGGEMRRLPASKMAEEA